MRTGSPGAEARAQSQPPGQLLLHRDALVRDFERFADHRRRDTRRRLASRPAPDLWGVGVCAAGRHRGLPVLVPVATRTADG